MRPHSLTTTQILELEQILDEKLLHPSMEYGQETKSENIIFSKREK
jgi:hypothetical protein